MYIYRHDLKSAPVKGTGIKTSTNAAYELTKQGVLVEYEMVDTPPRGPRLLMLRGRTRFP